MSPEMVIFTRTYDLLGWLLPKTERFPKLYRSTVTQRLMDAVLDFQEALYEAQAFDGKIRLRHLRQADPHLNKTRLYLRLAPIVYVGRSLAGFGGQNPLEPAVTGSAILSGKHVANFRDSYRSLLSRKAVRLVEDGNMLAANLEFLLKNPDERERMIQAAQDTVRDMRGALDRTIDVLDSYVFPLTVKRKLEDIGNGG